jgi:hypothetical protein
MDKQYRVCPEGFKLEVLELLKTSGKDAGQIERVLVTTSGLLTKWRAHFQIINFTFSFLPVMQNTRAEITY